MINRTTYQAVAGDSVVEFSGTAAGWPLSLAFRNTEEGNSRGPGVSQAHLDCERCHQSVLTLAPDLSRGGGYVISAGQLAAAVLRHVRERHCDGGGILQDM